MGGTAAIGQGGEAGDPNGGTSADAGVGGSAGDSSGGTAGTAGETSSGASAAGSGGTSAGSGGASAAGSGGTSAGSGGSTAGSSGSPAGGASGCSVAVCLAHRYRFDESGGTRVNDSVGTAHGTAVGGAWLGGGVVSLAGGYSGQHVNLPDGILSRLTDATIEAWVTWSGGAYWERIFDFGDNDDVAGGQINGRRYLLLTTNAELTGRYRLAYSLSGFPGETGVNGPAGFPWNVRTHVAAVVDATNSSLALFLNGALVDSVPFTGALSQINDVNNWIGRSQFAEDPYFGGTIHEFRIYSGARSAAQIRASYAAGPNTLPAD